MEKEKIKVLLAEDDRNLGNILKSYLEAKGYAPKLCINGQEAYDLFTKEQFDFCIVDVMMPVKDGFTLTREIREHDRNIPILFLTAKSLEEDKLKGFQAGADDYLTKPFSMEELLLRIEAILRRAGHSAQGAKIFRVGSFTLDYNRQILERKGKELRLTSKENDLLRLLCENTNEVLDRSYALNKIWQDDSYFNARSMDVYIAKLRKYLKEDPSVELINVHGVGFKLVVNT
ncbi:MAG: response regulator transcription factor [Lentimicrobiaceae bacterium]|jgi:DNA-binding response OmpR family regulator|nr:response regulator transcription factor [Lentimicrobiaceae bacterium]MDD4599337.1 response regulator transcription factor [Lentimicrobiaceae bacterium]MDY0026988.1 response regulator transcription factor [Lentimicrobium sp.]HAH57373.1 DNA-binding response regulator [Bacteroidales bacterium]